MVLSEIAGLRRAVRQLSFLLLGICAYRFMTAPAFLILTAENSLLFRAASLTRAPEVLGWLLLSLSLAVLPLQILSLFLPHAASCPTARARKIYRRTAQTAVVSFLLAALLWLYLLYVSMRMEAGVLPYILLFNCGCCGAVAIVLGDILNSDLLRLEVHRTKEKTC